eukprot:TRINITY_DN633_c0_g1_i1.p1 TRINITY_DN633_c0_g1~~TRINITY_DN633_c0_g1_i1.p1  ORF type:complete len:621 (-),score=144.06 TRINITY_DN633_c0_g1_i1:86-1948(-)
MTSHTPLLSSLSHLLLTIALLVIIPPITHSREVYTGLVNKQVTRTIDLSSQLARHTVELNIENTGSKSTQHLYLAIKTDFAQKLAHMKVTQSFLGSDKALDTKREDNHDNTKEYTLYRSLLRKPVEAGDTIDVVVELVFTHTMTPFPSEITQSERQLVRYNDNHYWFSVYRTDSVKTKVKLSSSSVQSNSELSPSSVKADVVSYGPYKDVAPLSYSPLSLHFENNKPFVTVKYVQRWVEVSHWGNVAVEEQYKVRHEGAKLKGSFSRYDFQINAQANGQAAVQILRQFLPETATDVYYRDDIGNISTSALRPDSPKQTFDMRPRFPLFGDWKTEFTVGYNVPTSSFLATQTDDSSRYVLTFPFMADWEAGIAVDTQVLKVVLPEGAKDISVNVPFDVDDTTFDRTVTYLDVISVGRPVVILTKHNLVNDHNVNFEIHYTFNSSSMFFEIFLLIGGFFTFFLTLIVILRIELPIEDSKRTDDATVVKLLEAISESFTQRTEYHIRLSEALDNYIKTSDEKAWDNERKSLLLKFSELKKKVAIALNQLGTRDGESASKLTEIEKKQAEKEAIQAQLIDSIIKYKVKKQQSKGDHEAEREELTSKYEEKQDELEEDLEDFFGI